MSSARAVLSRILHCVTKGSYAAAAELGARSSRDDGEALDVSEDTGSNGESAGAGSGVA